MKSKIVLRQPGEHATAADAPISRDLADTLAAHRATCAGMAANMIGERKRIIAVVYDDGSILVMFNPEVISGSGSYDAQEGCLSLPGLREARRYEHITVSYQVPDGEGGALASRQGEFAGRVAQAVQHEVDHCNGVLI